jgi:CheY-like chemotaxis protein
VANVLVVDDTPDCREPLVRFLKLAGYGTAAAANGMEALDYLKHHAADVVLLDLMMPEMDGVEFLRIIRGDSIWRNLPVIIVTALSEGPMLGEALRLNVKRSLLKSRFTGDELLTCIEEACGDHHAGTAQGN